MIEASNPITTNFTQLSLTTGGTVPANGQDGTLQTIRPGGNTLGQFYVLNGTDASIASVNETDGLYRLKVVWLYDPSSGGDPHVTTIRGDSYWIPNIEKSLCMYDNGEIRVETLMKRMPWNFWKRPVVEKIVKESTYLTQTVIKLNGEHIVISNRTLDVLNVSEGTEYSYTPYDFDHYHCYGKTIRRGDFAAKCLTIKTKKVSVFSILFVKLKDDTIITDMKILANPQLLAVPATGALVRKSNVHEWLPPFFYKSG
jgi:hypothetical protein